MNLRMFAARSDWRDAVYTRYARLCKLRAERIAREGAKETVR